MNVTVSSKFRQIEFNTWLHKITCYIISYGTSPLWKTFTAFHARNHPSDDRSRFSQVLDFLKELMIIDQRFCQMLRKKSIIAAISVKTFLAVFFNQTLIVIFLLTDFANFFTDNISKFHQQYFYFIPTRALPSNWTFQFFFFQAYILFWNI